MTKKPHRLEAVTLAEQQRKTRFDKRKSSVKADLRADDGMQVGAKLGGGSGHNDILIDE